MLSQHAPSVLRDTALLMEPARDTGAAARAARWGAATRTPTVGMAVERADMQKAIFASLCLA